MKLSLLCWYTFNGHSYEFYNDEYVIHVSRNLVRLLQYWYFYFDMFVLQGENTARKTSLTQHTSNSTLQMTTLLKNLYDRDLFSPHAPYHKNLHLPLSFFEQQ